MTTPQTKLDNAIELQKHRLKWTVDTTDGTMVLPASHVRLFISAAEKMPELERLLSIRNAECEAVCKKLLTAEQRVKEVEKERERLFDLVRYQRAELHQAELISDGEYTSLLADYSSKARLETYDDMRKQLSILRTEYRNALEEIKKLQRHYRIMYAINIVGLRNMKTPYDKVLSSPFAIAAMKGEV